VVYIDKSVTIMGGYNSMEDSYNPPEPWMYPTVIDAQDLGRGIYVAEDVTVTLEGLHIVNGNGTDLGGGTGSFPDAGGGIYLDRASTTISSCLVADNRSPMAGGLYVNRGTVIMQNNIITANTAISTNGGGLFLSSVSYAHFSQNTVASNTAGFNGGGLYIAYGMSDTIYSMNTIVSNTAASRGGGIFMASEAQIRDNEISYNTAGYGGGALYINGRSPKIAGNTFLGNYAAVYGGGIYLSQDALLQSNTILSNTTDRYAAGVMIYKSAGRLENNVIAQNISTAAYAGNGIFIWGGTPTLLHTTVAENVGGDSTCIYVRDDTGIPAYVAMKNTILVSQTVGVFSTGGSTVTMEGTLWGDAEWANVTDTVGTVLSSTNVTGDPGFINPQAGDYHIGADSPAVNSGVNAGVYTDIDNHPRFDGSTDIGADEFWYPTFLPTVLKL
jgi:predicted outer membrane repeat protein